MTSRSRIGVPFGRALLGAAAALLVGAAGAIAVQGTAPDAGVKAPLRPIDASHSAMTAARGQAAVGIHSTSIARWGLFFDDAFVGWLKSVSGCTMAYDVVTGVDRDNPKSVGEVPHVEPCVLEHGLMGTAYQDWLLEQVNQSASRNPDSLGIVGYDLAGVPAAAVTVLRPLLVGFDLPAGDASADGPAPFRSTIDGTAIVIVPRTTYAGATGTAGKLVQQAFFQLWVNGNAVPGAARVSAIRLTRTDVDRDAPTDWDVSNVDVETGWDSPGPFVRWYQSVLRDPSTRERSLGLLFYSQAGALTFKVDLAGVGIYRSDSGLRTPRRLFSLYAETASLTFP